MAGLLTSGKPYCGTDRFATGVDDNQPIGIGIAWLADNRGQDAQGAVKLTHTMVLKRTIHEQIGARLNLGHPLNFAGITIGEGATTTDNFNRESAASTIFWFA